MYYRIRPIDEEPRTTLSVLDRLKNEPWISKSLTVTNPGQTVCLFKDDNVEINLERLPSKPSKFSFGVYRFVKIAGGNIRYSSYFEVRKVGASTLYYNFVDEGTRTLVTCLEVLKKFKVSWTNHALQMTEIGSRIFLYHHKPEDTEIFLELTKIEGNRKFFRFVKKLYSNVTFTYESSVFEIII